MYNDTIYPDNILYLKSSSYSLKNSDSDVLFELNKPLHVPANVDIYIGLHSFFFTNAFYTVGINNNMFYYTLSGGAGFIQKSISIPIGFYNVDDLTYILNQTITDLSFSWNYYTYKMTITSSVAFIIDSGINNLYELLGFDISGSAIYEISKVGPKLFNMMNVQVIKLLFGNIYLNSINNETESKHNLLYALRVNVGPGEIQNYTPNSVLYHRLNENYITTLNILTLDDKDRDIEWNGVEWFLELHITFQYKKEFKLSNNLLLDYYNNKKPIDDSNDEASEYLKEEQTRNTNRELDKYIIKNNLLKELKRSIKISK
jgi:hypothetical protein